MSLMRRFSRRMSSAGRKDKKTENEVAKREHKPVDLSDNPVPTPRQMTTANLFQPMQSTSTQSTNMDRTLYEIPQPAQVDAMSDLIKDHEAGTFFPYVGVVGSEGESPDARRARLLALKPSLNKRDVPEIKVLGCPLISKEGDFTMKTLMAFAKSNQDPIPRSAGPVPSGVHNQDYSISKPYVHVKQVTILFTPNMSSTSNYCRFWMNLVDNRLIDPDKGSQTNVVVSNQEGILEMSCDYCVSVSDLDSFTLSYTLERDIVRPGFQWGTASFYFSITESDLPYQSSKVDAMAVYRMPITTLMDRKTNADKSDISFTPADITRLRTLYEAGDVVDVDEPQKSRLKTNQYTKSSIRSKPKGEKIDVGNKPGWDFMNGAVRHKIDANIASVDPSDDSSVDLPEVDTEAVQRNRRETLERYKKQQEAERSQQSGFVVSDTSLRSSSPEPGIDKIVNSSEPEDEEISSFFGRTKSDKRVRMDVSGV